MNKLSVGVSPVVSNSFRHISNSKLIVYIKRMYRMKFLESCINIGSDGNDLLTKHIGNNSTYLNGQTVLNITGGSDFFLL